MNVKRKISLGITVLLLVAFGASVAYAGTARTYVSGTLTTSGSVVYYSTVRTHTSGTIDMYIDDMPWSTPWSYAYLRLGLRDPVSNSQFTQSLQWDTKGSKTFKMTSGSTTIPAGKRFAMNGRMEASTLSPDNKWGGTLNH